MRIKINFSYRLKELVGTRDLEIELAEGSNVMDLLTILTKKYGEEFKKDVWAGENKTYVSVAINDKMSDANAELNENDKVFLSLPVPVG
jgi:molybdopterin converting factor small subunit